MGITVEVLIAIFTILLTISLAAERFIEVFKPLIEKISASWQASVKISVAILIGFGLSALFRFDLLKEMTVSSNMPLAGYALSGLIASTGSTTINRLLEWLKTLKGNVTTSVTTTTSQANVVVEETIVAKGSAPVAVK